MRLVIIAVSTIIGLIFVGLLIRGWGLGQPTPYYQSTFFRDGEPDIVALGGDTEGGFATHSIGAYRNALLHNPQYILGANVYLTQDKRLVILGDEVIAELGPEDLARQTEYRDLPGPPLLIEEFLAEFPESRFYIVLHDNVHNIHDYFVEKLETFDLDERILIRSPYDLITRAIKNLKPLWLYGSGSGEVTRFLALNSLYLEPLMKFYSDVYVTQPLSSQGRVIINESIVGELQRRRRRLAVGPIDNEDHWQLVQDLPVEIFITHKPRWLEAKVQTAR